MDTPRAANVLLVAGDIPESLSEALAHTHDAMSHPRVTVWWSSVPVPQTMAERFPGLVQVDGDVVEAVIAVHRDLLAGRRSSEPPILPDVDPVPWRGEGPYHQGGSGMTGGTPYGRPMAELMEDRDGLRLDYIPLKVGPFFPRFPVGLVLNVKMAGDVVLEAEAEPSPFTTAVSDVLAMDAEDALFARSLYEPVAVAELEMARARSHLRWLADALLSHELHALGLRALRLSVEVKAGDGVAVRRLARALSWTQVLRWSTAGVGRMRGDDLAGMGLGPVARAAGLEEDQRTDDPVYRELGFTPVVQKGGDAAARWRQRIAETVQSLDIAARAEGRETSPMQHAESPRGRIEPDSVPFSRLLPFVPDLIRGLEWGDAVTSLVSLDLDLQAIPQPRVIAEAAG